jgi:ubiquinone/menaquinone biosynthesis C-methylase UbiE
MRSALRQEHPRIDFFEKSARHYDLLLDLWTFGQYTVFLKRAVEVLSPEREERILDLCSGTGRVASWIARSVGREGEVVGMDISKGMIEVATNRCKGLRNVFFLEKDVTTPWEYQSYFNGIFASFAMHELPESKRLEIFKESYLALKENGRVVIGDFNSQVSGKGKTFSLIFFKLFEKENLSFFSFDQNEMLRKAGFKEIKTIPVLSNILQITVALKI